MAEHSDIGSAAESAIGDADVLKLISEGMRRNERVEIKRQGDIPKRAAVYRYEVEHDLDILPWCGLVAISCLTGTPTSIVRHIIRDYREDDSAVVQGTLDEEVIYAFDILGYSCSLVYFCHAPLYNQAPTMARWLREFERQSHIGYLIGQRGVGRKAGHWCTVHSDQYCCPLTNYQWIDINKAPGRRQRMSSAYAISKK